MKVLFAYDGSEGSNAAVRAAAALLNRDGPIIIACVIVSAVAIVVSNLLVDLVYARLDPRVRVPSA